MRSTKNRGFTLVELFASIGVIALSLAICLPAPEQSLAEVDEEEGPVTVRMYVVDAGDRDLQQIETEIREGLIGTHFDFCGAQPTRETKGGAVEVALWTPADTAPEADLEQLRKVFGETWNVRRAEEEQTLVASNS